MKVENDCMNIKIRDEAVNALVGLSRISPSLHSHLHRRPCSPVTVHGRSRTHVRIYVDLHPSHGDVVRERGIQDYLLSCW